MAVRKFRSVEEMSGPSPLPRLDPENLRIACGLSSLAEGFHPMRRTPGVYKHRSWDEAMAARKRREQELARRARRG
jgi:hypothetical protein